MHIDNYKFGEIVIDGQTYSNDVILFSSKVQDNWWRKQGHSLAPEDLETVFDYQPDVLVVGRGHSSMMKVPESTKDVIKNKNIQLITEKTAKACEIFNEKISQNKNVVGAFHLTC